MTKKYIKSPFNYIGGKYKLLPQILPLFPDKISTFYDVFGGGGSLSLNVDSSYVYYNDIVPYVGEVLDEMARLGYEECISKIEQVIEEYNLSKTNKEGFERLRQDYNSGKKEWHIFYTLVCYSFNSQYRFNNNHEYNSSFGKNKSWFSDTTKKKIKEFIERANEIHMVYDGLDYLDIDFSDANENDLVYFDPPYLITCGNYNDGKRGFKGWTQQDDINLMELCDKLNEQGIRFAMSNVFEDKGKTNDLLKEWSKKYTVYHLNNTYGNCNYQAKDKSTNTTDEVLIVNY